MHARFANATSDTRGAPKLKIGADIAAVEASSTDPTEPNQRNGWSLSTTTEVKEYPGRSHLMPAQNGWEAGAHSLKEGQGAIDN